MLNVTGISVKYNKTDEAFALFDVSFSIMKGERVAVIGANGAGKSTLLLTITGVVLPDTGNIEIDGEATNKKNFTGLRRKSGLVFQNPDDQLFMASVYDDIAFGPRNFGVSEEETEKRINSVLNEFNIMHMKNKMTHKLSGGEKRLAALAGVLVTKPSVLLLDEPSSFLDPRSRRLLIETLTNLPQAMLIATHDLDMALDLCQRTILLKEGRIYADASTKDILYDFSLLKECALEPPLSAGRK